MVYRFLLLFLIVASMVIFFSININQTGNKWLGTKGLYLLVFVVIFGCLILLAEIFSKKIYIKKSSFILALFFLYFMANTMINLPESLKAYTIATNGGIILFYALGAFVSIGFNQIHENYYKSDKFISYYNTLFLFLIALFLYVISSSFYYHISLGESVSFFDHQRKGSFLVISYAIYSLFFVHFVLHNKRDMRRSASKIFVGILTICYFMTFAIGMVTVQLFGSNNAFVSIGGLMFLSLAFIFFKQLFNKGGSKDVQHEKTSHWLKGFILVAISFLVLLLSFVALVYLFDIDIFNLRFFRADISGGLVSLTSRLDLLDHFMVHFSYNPIFGNMSVDRITTGLGTYAHSFPLALLTHLGVVGFLLFFTYLYLAFKERVGSSQKQHLDSSSLIFETLLFCGIFSMATIATFITWPPIWFVLGLLFPPILIKSRGGSFSSLGEAEERS